MSAKWTVQFTPGQVLTGVHAQRAELMDCEPYALAKVFIPAIGFERVFDDRLRSADEILAIARKVSQAPAMAELLQSLADTEAKIADSGDRALALYELAKEARAILAKIEGAE